MERNFVIVKFVLRSKQFLESQFLLLADGCFHELDLQFFCLFDDLDELVFNEFYLWILEFITAEAQVKFFVGFFSQQFEYLDEAIAFDIVEAKVQSEILQILQLSNSSCDIDHSLITNVVFKKVNAQKFKVDKLQDEIFGNSSSSAANSVHSCSQGQFSQLSKLSNSIDDMLISIISEILRSNSKVKFTEGFKLSQKITNSFSSLIINKVKVQIETQLFELLSGNTLDAVTYIFSSDCSDIVEIQINIEGFKICLGSYGFGYDGSAFSSDLICIEVQIQSFEVGSGEMSFQIPKRFVTKPVSNQDQRIAFQLPAQSSESQVIIDNYFILHRQYQRYLQLLQRVKIIQPFCKYGAQLVICLNGIKRNLQFLHSIRDQGENIISTVSSYWIISEIDLDGLIRLELYGQQLLDIREGQRGHGKGQIQGLDIVEFVGVLELIDISEGLELGSPVGMILNMSMTDLESLVLNLNVDEVFEHDG